MALKLRGDTIIDEAGKTLLDLDNQLKQIEEDIKNFNPSSDYDAIPVGTIIPFTVTNMPNGYLLCDGSEVLRSDYPGLFEVIGTYYGKGDGVETFNLPDLRGKIPVGQDTNDDTFNNIGKEVGEKTHTLNHSEMPKHAHNQGVLSNYGYPNAIVGNDNYINDPNVQNWSSGGYVSGGTWNAREGWNMQTALTGGGQAHNNIQPSLVVSYIIKASNTAVLKGNVVDSVMDGSSTNAPSQRAVQEYVDEKMGEGVSAKVIIDRWDGA